MSLWSRVVNVVRGDRLIREIDEELESHVAEAIAQGRDPAEARQALGSALRLREASRDVRQVVWFGDFLMDARYAARTLARQPGFLLAAVMSLGLGIGANITIFSLIDAVMLQAIPVSEPQQLVQITRKYADGQRGGSFSYPLFEYLRDGSHTFSGIFAQSTSLSRTQIDLDGMIDSANVALVSGSYYAVLGVAPAAGRLLVADDDKPGTGGVAVMSYRYWLRRFGLNPTAVGTTFSLNDAAVTIVGISPSEFFGTLPGTDADLTLPLSMARLVRGGDDSWRQIDGYNFLSVMARLRPGLRTDHAFAEIRTIFANRLQVQAGRSHDPNEQRRILGQTIGLASARNGFNGLRARFSEPLLILMVIVGFVLLLACANLSSLFAARAAARHREILVRSAIGAGRGRLIRQFLTESLVLATLGSAAGVMIAIWCRSALVAMMANGGTLTLPMTADWRLFAFVGGITLATCLLIGFIPGLHATGADGNAAATDLRGGTRRALGNALLIGQIAISLILLVGATLFVGTLITLYSTDAGFRRDGILTFILDTTEKPGNPHRQAVESELLQRIGRLPGVASTSAVQILFISGGGWNGSVQVEGYTPGPNEEPMADFNAVAPKFFDTTGTSLIAGRDFDERDGQSSEPVDERSNLPAGHVAIVNESFMKAYFGDRSPLGRHVSIGKVGAGDYEIVGVARDAKYLNLREAFPKTIYFVLGRKRFGAATLLVRTAAGNPMWALPHVETLLRTVDPAMHLGSVRTFAEQVDRSILNERIMATLGAFFGGLALVIACIGIFGVMTFQVAQRTREFGIRMALGATRSHVMVLAFRDVSVMLIVGCVIGSAVAAVLTRLVKSLLFGVTATDPVVFLFAIALLAASSVCAGYAPARRAARADPIVALRHE